MFWNFHIFSGAKKLSLPPCVHQIDLTLVLNEDGTVIDDDEVLMECKTCTLLLLMPSENWSREQTSITETGHNSEMVVTRDIRASAASSPSMASSVIDRLPSVSAPCVSSSRSCDLSIRHSPDSNQSKYTDLI